MVFGRKISGFEGNFYPIMEVYNGLLAEFFDKARIAAMCARSKEEGIVEGSKDFWYFDVQEGYF